MGLRSAHPVDFLGYRVERATSPAVSRRGSRSRTIHLALLLDPLVAGIGIDDSLLPVVVELWGRGQVMHVGRGRFDRVDQAVVLAHTDVDSHPVVPLFAPLGLVHLGISLALLVLGKVW